MTAHDGCDAASRLNSREGPATSKQGRTRTRWSRQSASLFAESAKIRRFQQRILMRNKKS